MPDPERVKRVEGEAGSRGARGELVTDSLPTLLRKALQAGLPRLQILERMTAYDPEKIREFYYALAEIRDTFNRASKDNLAIESSLVTVYEDFLKRARQELPGLLESFNKDDFFSHDNGTHGTWYRSPGINAHIGGNFGILRSKAELTSQDPITESTSFTFISDIAIRKILERDYQEIQRSLISLNWKSTIILSGGSIEAILLDLLQKNFSSATASPKAPRNKSDIKSWDLNDLIEVGVDINAVKIDLAKLSHTVREYRNLIHPGKEINSELRVEPEEAKIAFQILKILIRDLT